MANSVPSMQDLLEAGVHFGHQVRRGNPKMGQYIFGTRDGVHIINLEESEKLLNQAAEYVKKITAEGKVILFIGTKKQAQELIKEKAGKLGAPYVDYKWMAGFLTNFEEMRRNMKKLEDLKEQQAKGELGKYTKKEQLLITRKLLRYEQIYGGVAKMENLPDAIFIIDTVAEKTALAEANKMQIPVVAICDSNSNPSLVDYPIPGNDDAAKSIKILTEAIFDSYEEGKKKSSAVSHQSSAKSQETSDSLKTESEASLKAEDQIAAPVIEEVAVIEEEVEKKVVEEAKTIV